MLRRVTKKPRCFDLCVGLFFEPSSMEADTNAFLISTDSTSKVLSCYLCTRICMHLSIYTYCFSPHDFFLNKNIKKAQRHLCISMRRLPQK